MDQFYNPEALMFSFSSDFYGDGSQNTDEG